jgi:hypothetical protein
MRKRTPVDTTADPWRDLVLTYFASQGLAEVSIEQLLRGLEIPATRANEVRVGRILLQAGFQKRRTSISPVQRRFFYRPLPISTDTSNH